MDEMDNVNNEELSEVTSSRIFIGKSHNIDEDGLFSEKIFGPEKDYKCKCGKLNSKVFDAGKRCQYCGVLCESNELRLQQFGKITVPFGYIKPNRKKKLHKIVGNKNKQLLNPVMAQASLGHKRYLGFTLDGEHLKIFNDLTPNPEGKFYKLPLRITGLYSFLLCLKYLGFTLNIPYAKQFFDDKIIDYEIKVIPPKTRPLAILSNNTIQITDINKAYSNLIRRNEANRPIINNLPIDEENWLGMIHSLIKDNILNEELVDHGILEYDRILSIYQYSVNEIYSCVCELLHGKGGFIRSKILGKTIEFSARSVIRSNPGLKPHQVSVSKKILYKLWHLYFLYYLINIRNMEADYCYLTICSREYEDNKELFDDFLKWFNGDDDE